MWGKKGGKADIIKYTKIEKAINFGKSISSKYNLIINGKNQPKN